MRTEELSPSMRRIVLGGADLEPEFPFLPLAVADHVKLAFPDPDTGELTLPEGGSRGPAGSGGPAPVMRDYTIRHVDHDARELSLDFVLHPHGPAGRWAAAAAPGHELGVLGPRGSQLYPGTCASYLIVADETGLPATERFLTELPSAARVRVLALLPADGSARTLDGESRAEVTWLPDTTLVHAVAGTTLDAGTFVWAAGEAGIMQKLRRHLHDERGLDAEHVVVRGYWRTGTAGALPPGTD